MLDQYRKMCLDTVKMRRISRSDRLFLDRFVLKPNVRVRFYAERLIFFINLAKTYCQIE